MYATPLLALSTPYKILTFTLDHEYKCPNEKSDYLRPTHIMRVKKCLRKAQHDQELLRYEGCGDFPTPQPLSFDSL